MSSSDIACVMIVALMILPLALAIVGAFVAEAIEATRAQQKTLELKEEERPAGDESQSGQDAHAP